MSTPAAADRGLVLARSLLIAAGAAAMGWAVTSFPVFWSENLITRVALGVRSGEIYKSEIVESSLARIEADQNLKKRASALVKASLVRLRGTEDALSAGNIEVLDTRFDALRRTIDDALALAPSDGFVWLARFWLENVRLGLRPEHMKDLRMSYEFGRYESWIAYKRSRVALAIYPALPNDLAEFAAAEFVNFIHWGLFSEAAELASGPGRAVRQVLFARLKDFKRDLRREFAGLMYNRQLDDVLVPGIDPPRQPYQAPILPPGY